MKTGNTAKKHLRVLRTARDSVSSPVSFQTISANRKLSRVVHLRKAGQQNPTIVPPKVGRVSSLYVSITSTCPDTCSFRNNGCYAQAANRKLIKALDGAAARLTPERVEDLAVGAIDKTFKYGVPQDGARGGRDFRLHESGDVTGGRGVREYAAAAERWLARGGGEVWTVSVVPRQRSARDRDRIPGARPGEEEGRSEAGRNQHSRAAAGLAKEATLMTATRLEIVTPPLQALTHAVRGFGRHVDRVCARLLPRLVLRPSLPRQRGRGRRRARTRVRRRRARARDGDEPDPGGLRVVAHALLRRADRGAHRADRKVPPAIGNNSFEEHFFGVAGEGRADG